MAAYYNEFDPFAAAWLRELIKAGQIAPGDVDERDIQDVRPDDLIGYTQCHFFAGIGVWSYALRRAGWPDDRPVWTGSCPCQPFSAAGKGGGFTDERHLWPAQFHLIRECRPDIWLGEQVATKKGLAWLDLVSTDLEAEGYAVGAVDTCSAGFGAPHIRQRIRIAAQRLADAGGAGSQGRIIGRDSTGECAARSGGMELQEQPGPVNGFWRSADWLYCRDGKWRPVSPKPQPLVDGSAISLGRVRHEDIQEFEEEVNAWAMESKIDRDQALRDLFVCYGAEAQSKWAFGRIPGLHEAPFLLSFLRQLTEQGWAKQERLPVSCAEVREAVVRSVWGGNGTAGASRQRGLEGQQAREYSDALLVLSSILARRARKTWGVAYDAYAETAHPLTIGAANRLGRLRGYGNAVDAEATRAFIEAVTEN